MNGLETIKMYMDNMNLIYPGLGTAVVVIIVFAVLKLGKKVKNIVVTVAILAGIVVAKLGMQDAVTTMVREKAEEGFTTYVDGVKSEIGSIDISDYTVNIDLDKKSIELYKK